MKGLKIFTFCFAILLISFEIQAQQIDSAKIAGMTREEIMSLSQDDLLEMSMENLVFLAKKMGISIDELLNMKTNVASKSTLTPRETPGIVSFITQDEIRYSGASDLIDVLRLIPGFDFGYDVSGVVGVGLRGNWVHEGKILIMMDGQPMNELNYFNTPFGNHFPVDQIKRIEIIRGPGSAIYGGNAELGVVNIITKSGKDLEGVEIAGTYGQMQRAMGRANLNLNTGVTVNNWNINANGFLGTANRSDQMFYEYIDFKENLIDFSEGGSKLKTGQFNLGISHKALSMRLIYDNYQTEYCYYDSINYVANDQFRTLLGEVKYDLKLNDKVTITPKVNYRYNRPYYEEDYWRNCQINEYRGSLVMNYTANDKFSLVTGFEYINDKAETLTDEGYFYSTGETEIDLRNVALFGEGTFKLKKVNMVTGFRAENSNIYGWACAPRIGFTGIFNKFHFKLLFSGAFRTPAIGNIDVAEDIKPEKSYVSEIEIGYRINDNMFVTANFYDIRIKKSIAYYDTGSGWEPIIDWGYYNADNAGSNGMELEFKARYGWGFASAYYAFYTQAFQSLPFLYSVPGHENSALGLSQHQIGMYGSYKITSKLAISPTIIYIGKKYAYTDVDIDGDPVVGEINPAWMINVSLNYEPVKGLDFNLAVNDLLNEKPPFAHPYRGWYSAYPGRSREILIKMIVSTNLFRN